MLLLDFFTKPSIFTADCEFLEFALGTQHILEKSSDYNHLHRWLGDGLLTSKGDIFAGGARGHHLVKEPPLPLRHFVHDHDNTSAMGVTVNAQVNEDSRYVKNIQKICQLFMNRAYSIYKRNDLLYMLSLDYHKEKKVVKELHDVTYSVIDARRKKLEKNKSDEKEVDDTGRKNKKAFLDTLLQSTIDGMPLSNEDIRAEVDTFMFGGHDTISTTISFTLYLLSKHPDVQKLAFEEQKEIFGDDVHRNSTYSDLNKMNYLDLVIKECLRILPPVTIIGREVTKDVKYKGNIIPAGTDIFIFIYGVLHDPKNFPDPEKFDPLRFRNSTSPAAYSYLPFSAGPRNCIGRKFAMLEMKSCVSKILRNFELTPASSEYTLELVSEIVLKSKNGVRAKLIKRK
ncbi:hypothetical protein NQ317_003790, partial [Molorchus minor]